MEHDSGGIILVGRNISCAENPPELSDAEKLAKKTYWKERIERVRCVVAPMYDQRLVSVLLFYLPFMSSNSKSLCISHPERWRRSSKSK